MASNEYLDRFLNLIKLLGEITAVETTYDSISDDRTRTSGNNYNYLRIIQLTKTKTKTKTKFKKPAIWSAFYYHNPRK